MMACPGCPASPRYLQIRISGGGNKTDSFQEKGKTVMCFRNPCSYKTLTACKNKLCNLGYRICRFGKPPLIVFAEPGEML
jgi:hypothetical protein